MTVLQRSVLFGGYCLAVAAAQWHVLRALYDYSRSDETASHLVLIPVVTAGLIWLDRNPIFAAPRTAWREGVAVIGAGVVLLIAALLLPSSASAQASLITAVAAVAVLWAGGFLLLFGPQASRAALFPLVFLVFMVPIPQPVLDATVEFLKNGSTEATAALFTLTGTTYYREAYVFVLPTVNIEVVDACSGIRSTIALALTGLLAGHMYLRTGWAKVLLLLFIVPLSILKNAVRIVTLTLLAVHVDPGYLDGQLHHDGGMVFFGLSLLVMAPFLALLRRLERPPVSNAAPATTAIS
jgi:exosortase